MGASASRGMASTIRPHGNVVYRRICDLERISALDPKRAVRRWSGLRHERDIRAHVHLLYHGLTAGPAMKLIFSRKGFDSAAGGVPSPIIEGTPISIPIPTTRRSETSYRRVGLGDTVEKITRGRISADHLCHEDPAFANGRWAFGQTGTAQSHLANNAVGVGDVFLFFGLFASNNGKDRHHRIFGYLVVDEVRHLRAHPSKSDSPDGFERRHPHTIGEWDENNTLYLGHGMKAEIAHPSLRLTRPDAPVSVWSVPTWLKAAGLTYHSNPLRWTGDCELHVASRGQEFVSNISDNSAARGWLHKVCTMIGEGTCGH